MEDFCYLGNYLSINSNNNKDCLTRIGKAASVFGRLKAVWKNKYISVPVKVKLHESLVMSKLYCTVQNYGIWLLHRRRNWKLRTTGFNDNYWESHGGTKYAMQRSRLNTLDIRTNHQTKNAEMVWTRVDCWEWMMTGCRNRPYPGKWVQQAEDQEASRKNWNDIIRQDLKSIGVAWEDAEHFTFDRGVWHERVAQCVLTDTGWTKV